MGELTTGSWFTAIPLAYREGESFWTRDAGLLCTGLRNVGVDARFVCLGQKAEQKDLPLLLAEREELTDSAWWSRWNLEGVLIISWALPQFELIVRAIRA